MFWVKEAYPKEVNIIDGKTKPTKQKKRKIKMIIKIIYNPPPKKTIPLQAK